MQKLSSFLFTTLISMSIVALAGESGAQNSAGTLPPKAGTRLITLGTRGGPIPMGGRGAASKRLVFNRAVFIVGGRGGGTPRLTRSGVDLRRNAQYLHQPSHHAPH